MQITGKLKVATSGGGMRCSVGTADNIRFGFTVGGGPPGSGSAGGVVPTDISLSIWPMMLLQTGLDSHAFWIEDNAWGAGTLTRGTYTGLSGSSYESTGGVSHTMGSAGAIGWRSTWKWPTGVTEVKSYPSAVFGAKPGWFDTGVNPAGDMPVLLLDGTTRNTAPSGPTPGTFFPIQLPMPTASPVLSRFNWTHNTAPSGRGQLVYDIWLQNSATQSHGFTAPPISHEIMIPLNYWGDYGAHGVRNPAPYDSDVNIDGRLWHLYYTSAFGSGNKWRFIVFEPDSSSAVSQGSTLNLTLFVNYVVSRGWADSTNYCVSVELGVEAVEGVGDITVYDYNVTQP